MSEHTQDVIDQAIAAHELAGIPLDDAFAVLIDECDR